MNPQDNTKVGGTVQTAKTLMVDVWRVGQPVSKGEIALAIDYFRLENVDRPDQLILGIDAYRDLAKAHAPEITRSMDLHTFMGLHIRIDPDLDEDEWRVRKSDVRVDILRGQL